jgi:hypothetical protein
VERNDNEVEWSGATITVTLVSIYLSIYLSILSYIPLSFRDAGGTQDVNDEIKTQLSRRRLTRKRLLAITATCHSSKKKNIRRYEANPRNNPTVDADPVCNRLTTLKNNDK